MGSLSMVQIFINFALGIGLVLTWIRLSRPAKDDPRLSRGLQLLQSKIAVLEDLSDRTDHQVKQLTLLLEEKAKHVQSQIEAAQSQIHRLHESMKKSHEVAKIFQDKIPHEEIVDRQNTLKYIKAAQMSHQGATIEEIEKAVDIPRSELEFLFKVNREKLMFEPGKLPDWAAYEPEVNVTTSPAVERAYREAFELPPIPSNSLSQIGEEFRKAVGSMRAFEETEPEVIAPMAAVAPNAPSPQQAVAPVATAPVIPAPVTTYDGKKLSANILTGATAVSAKPFQFPRVDTKL